VSDFLNAATSSFDAFTFSPLMTPLPSSAKWNLRFSRRITLPLLADLQVLSTSGPTQSFKKSTFF
jgi:hypothetical protein